MRILIIGGSGFLGSRLKEVFNGNCQSTYHEHRVFPDQIHLDLSDELSIRACLAETKPKVVFHCGGLTNTDFCETHQELATRTNVFGTEILLNEFNGEVIYFSTDYVFDGENAPYNENSQPNPVNHYGKTKLLAERKVLEKPQNLVVRVSGLYGFNKHNNRFIDKIRNSRVIRATKDFFSTPTYIEDIAHAIPDLMQISGVLHFSGEQSFSRYEFAKKVVEGLGLNAEVLPQESNWAGTLRRPRDSSLISVYELKKTGIEEALNEMRGVI